MSLQKEGQLGTARGLKQPYLGLIHRAGVDDSEDENHARQGAQLYGVLGNFENKEEDEEAEQESQQHPGNGVRGHRGR